jgi:hypothetical protein
MRVYNIYWSVGQLRPRLALVEVFGKSGLHRWAAAISESRDVWFGSKAEIRQCQRHDRYAFDSGHIATVKQNNPPVNTEETMLSGNGPQHEE